MLNKYTRRWILMTGSATFAVAASPTLALNTTQAKALIDKVVSEINAVINSGKSERKMYGDFERIFGRYADMPTIARSVLGPPARSASAGQMRAFSNAFKGYIARKYGKRFRELIGGNVVVKNAEPWKSHFQVHTTAILKGTAPFAVTFRVSDRSGKELFFDMLIEGISLLRSEREEIAALLDQRRGDINRLTNDLKSLG